jgi:hypothetical protein
MNGNQLYYCANYNPSNLGNVPCAQGAIDASVCFTYMDGVINMLIILAEKGAINICDLKIEMSPMSSRVMT